MANPQHIEWLKEGREAWNARRERDDFVPDFSLINKKDIPLNLIGYNLRKANFSRSNLAHYVLRPFEFEHPFVAAELEGANFEGCVLTYMRFDKADLRNANFSHSILDYADFTDAQMSEAKLDGADFGGAYLIDTDLRNASLTNTAFNTVKIRGADVRDTDLSKSKYLRKDTYHRMIGNAGTKLPKRLPFPEEWKDDTAAPDAEAALETAPVQSASYDFTVEDTGVTARLPTDHSAAKSSYGLSGQQRAAALIANARSIAQSVSNKLGEETRADLLAYASHLEQEDPANPHRLSFIAKGIAADLSDPFVIAGYSERLKIQLRDFLDQHDAFLRETVPTAAEAIDYKDSIEPARAPTEADATEVLENMEQAIARAEAATESMTEVLQGLRDHEAEIKALKLRAFSESDHAKLEQVVKRATVERATLLARLYWRAQQVVSKVRLHSGDIAIAASVTGKTGPEMAKIIVDYLHPLMLKLQELLPMLPPVG